MEDGMKTEVTKNGDSITIAVSGRIDSDTAPELAGVIEGILDETQSLVLDFKEVTYMSVSGLRLLLSALQIMYYKDGSLSIINASDSVKKIWNITKMDEFQEIK